MDGFKRVLWTIGLVAVWEFCTLMTIYQWDIFGMNSDNWRAVLAGVLGGIGAMVTNALMPFIKQYGFGAKEA